MANSNSNESVIAIARLSEKGQLTIPAEYRRTHALSKDSALVLVEIGDALVLVPHDRALSALSDRLQAALRGAGVRVEDLIAAAAKARAEIVQAEFGDEANQ